MTLTILITILSLRLTAPTDSSLILVVGEGIHYDPMLYSFMKVESNFDKDTVNSLGYGGILQIGSEMIAECNRILGLKRSPLKYVLEDRLDSAKSVEVWYLIQNWHNKEYELKRACKIWNPLASKEYIKRLKKYL
jgi:hypothetical protein